MKDLLEIAAQACRLGASILKEHYGKIGVSQADQKGLTDYVSEVDRRSEEAIQKFVLNELPASSFLGEEEGQVGEGKEYRWIVDPLDGTSNYLHRFPAFAVSVALEKCSAFGGWGEVIAGAVTFPLTGDIWTAAKGSGASKNGSPIHVARTLDVRGALLATGFPYRESRDAESCLRVFENVFNTCADIRRPGAAALDLCWVAEGVFDGFWEFGLKAWDIAAGGLIIKEAGGHFTSFDGDNVYLTSGNVVGGNPQIHQQMLNIIQNTLQSL
ncbi:inositol monophosphatase [bacterium]|nr:inositol monophosphatase [bacterium]